MSLFANQGEESIQNRLVIAIEGYDGTKEDTFTLSPSLKLTLSRGIFASFT